MLSLIHPSILTWPSYKPLPRPPSISIRCRIPSCNSACKMGPSVMVPQGISIQSIRHSPSYHPRGLGLEMICSMLRQDKRREHYLPHDLKRLNNHRTLMSIIPSMGRRRCKRRHRINIYSIQHRTTPAHHRSYKINHTTPPHSVCKLLHHHPSPLSDKITHRKHHLHSQTMETESTLHRMGDNRMAKQCHTAVAAAADLASISLPCPGPPMR